MRVSTTKVLNGRIEVSAGSLAEGETVRVLVLEEEPLTLTPEESAWLRNTLSESENDTVRDFEEFLGELESTD